VAGFVGTAAGSRLAAKAFQIIALPPAKIRVCRAEHPIDRVLAVSKGGVPPNHHNDVDNRPEFAHRRFEVGEVLVASPVCGRRRSVSLSAHLRQAGNKGLILNAVIHGVLCTRLALAIGLDSVVVWVRAEAAD
jgi:hypothetical protein